MTNGNIRFSQRRRTLPRRQRGALTMFSAILILILLTEVILYAAQVGVFEQRKSANDMRQKQAFHAAEAGLQEAKEFFLANVSRLSFEESGGWLNADSLRWTICPEFGGITEEHPCSGEALASIAQNTALPAELRTLATESYGGTYFYDFADDPDNPPDDSTLLPINPDDETLGLGDVGSRVEVRALLCVLDIMRDAGEGNPVVQGCKRADEMLDGDHIYFVLTLLARGQAACEDPTDPDTCEAEALVAEKVGSFGPAAGDGGPGVPLTTRSNFPPGGTAEIVPNPNGGGPGVPVSAWINGRPEGSLCPQQEAPIDPSSGSWSTCERHEWYGVDAMPEDWACPTANCSCGSDERRISYAEGGTQHVGIDIVIDDAFPCDLFASTFGQEKTLVNFNSLMSSIGTEIDDCGILDETSGESFGGVYWMTGDTCTINSNQVIGSKDFPVFLVSAAETTRVNGGAELWGVLFVSDALHDDATFESAGTNTIYGAVVVDAELGSYSGTFQIVYIDSLVRLASQSGGIGEISGGWTDDPQPWRP